MLFCFASMFVDKQQKAHEKTLTCSYSLLQRHTNIPHKQTEMTIHPSILFSLFSLFWVQFAFFFFANSTREWAPISLPHVRLPPVVLSK